MKNNTLYASDITYEFEKTGIAGSNNDKILGDVKNDMEGAKALIQKNLNTYMIFMIKIQEKWFLYIQRQILKGIYGEW